MTDMPDTLRTRIAKVLFALNAGEDWNMEPLVWEEATESYRECWFRQADAVIRELRLADDPPPYCMRCGAPHRSPCKRKDDT